jgi:hypothetical protein
MDGIGMCVALKIKRGEMTLSIIFGIKEKIVRVSGL